MRNVLLDNLERISTGGRSDIYRFSDTKILKLYHDDIKVDEIEKMIYNSNIASDAGLYVMKLYEIVKTSKGLALICDYIDGEPLSKKMHLNTANFEKYAILFVDLSKKLANTILSNALYYTNDFYKGALNRLSGLLTQDEIDTYEELVMSVPCINYAVHGDFHLRNVMCDKNDRLILIDLDDLSPGHMIWDISSMAMAYYVNPIVHNEENLIRYSGLNNNECKMFWDIFIDKYFEDISDEEKKNRIDASIVYAYVRELRMAAILYSMGGKNEGHLSLEYMKKKLNELSKKIVHIKKIFESWK